MREHNYDEKRLFYMANVKYYRNSFSMNCRRKSLACFSFEKT